MEQVTNEILGLLSEDETKEVKLVAVKHKGKIYQAVVAADFARLVKAKNLGVSTSAVLKQKDKDGAGVQKVDVDIDNIASGNNLLSFALVEKHSSPDILKKPIIRGKISQLLGEWVQGIFDEEEEPEKKS